MSLCFDSRLVKNGDLFIALNGENFKAAKFVEMSLGASYAVVNGGTEV